MKTPKEWILIYNLMDAPTPLEELIRMAQFDAIEQTVKACSGNIIQASMRKTWDKVENELKSIL
jgi:hypothetical protein